MDAAKKRCGVGVGRVAVPPQRDPKPNVKPAIEGRGIVDAIAKM